MQLDTHQGYWKWAGTETDGDTINSSEKASGHYKEKKNLVSYLTEQSIDVEQERTVKAQHCLNDSVKNSENIILIKSWPIAHSFFHST